MTLVLQVFGHKSTFCAHFDVMSLLDEKSCYYN